MYMGCVLRQVPKTIMRELGLAGYRRTRRWSAIAYHTSNMSGVLAGCTCGSLA